MVLNDPVPLNTTFVSATSSQGTVAAAGGAITGNLGDMANGDSAPSPSRFGSMPAPLIKPSISNTAMAAMNSPVVVDDNPANRPSAIAINTVNTSADIQVTKTDSPDPVNGNANLSYTIVVTNAGPSDAQNVKLSDTVPANTTFVSFTAPAGWTNTTPAVGAMGNVTSTLGTLAFGGITATFTFF